MTALNTRDAILQSAAVRIVETGLPGDVIIDGLKRVELTATPSYFRVFHDGEPNNPYVTVKADLIAISGTPVFTAQTVNGPIPLVDTGIPTEKYLEFKDIDSDVATITVSVLDTSEYQTFLNLDQTFTDTLEVTKIYDRAPLPVLGIIQGFNVAPIADSAVITVGVSESIEYRRVKVWMGTTADFNMATVVGEFSTTQFQIQGLDKGVVYRFWIQLLDPVYDALGELVGPQSLQITADSFLTLLEGEITSSQLHETLTTPIELITAPAEVEGSVEWKLAQEAQARIEAIEGEAQARATAIGLEAQARTDAITQEVQDRTAAVTQLSGEITAEAQARATAIGLEAQARLSGYQTLDELITTVDQGLTVERTERQEADHSLALEQAVFLAATATAAAATTTLNTAYTTENESIASQISTFQASVEGKAEAVLVQDLTSRVEVAEGVAISASQAITSLQNSLLDENGEISLDVTGVFDLNTRVENVEGSLLSQGQQITALQASIVDVADADAFQLLEAKVTQNENDITSTSNQLTLLQNGLPNLIANSLVISELTSTVEDLDGQITAESLRIDQLTTNVAGNTSSITATNQAISDETQARSLAISQLGAQFNNSLTNYATTQALSEAISTSEQSTAQTINTLETSFTQDINAAVTTLSESISSESSVRASEISNINSQLGGVNAAISQEASTRAEENHAQSLLTSVQTAAINSSAASSNVLKEVVVTENEARVSEITQLSAEIQGVSAQYVNAVNLISNETMARTVALETLSAEFETELGTTSLAFTTQLNEAITTEQQARASALNTVESQFSQDISAAVSSLMETVSDETQARTIALNALESNFQGQLNSKASITQLNEAITTEQQARASAVQLLEADIGDVEGQILEESSVRATELDFQSAILAVQSAAVESAAGAHTTMGSLFVTESEVTAEEINRLDGRVNNTNATMLQYRNLQVQENSVLLEQLDLLEGKVDTDNQTLDGKIEDAKTLIINEDGVEAIASDTISVVFSDDTTEVSGDLIAVRNAILDENGFLGSRLESIRGEIGDAQNTINGRIDGLNEVYVTEEQAEGLSYDAILTAFDTSDTNVSAAALAARQAISSETGFIGSAISELRGNYQGTLGQLNSSITTVSQAVGDANGGLVKTTQTHTQQIGVAGTTNTSTIFGKIKISEDKLNEHDDEIGSNAASITAQAGRVDRIENRVGRAIEGDNLVVNGSFLQGDEDRPFGYIPSFYVSMDRLDTFLWDDQDNRTGLKITPRSGNAIGLTFRSIDLTQFGPNFYLVITLKMKTSEHTAEGVRIRVNELDGSGTYDYIVPSIHLAGNYTTEPYTRQVHLANVPTGTEFKTYTVRYDPTEGAESASLQLVNGSSGYGRSITIDNVRIDAYQKVADADVLTLIDTEVDNGDSPYAFARKLESVVTELYPEGFETPNTLSAISDINTKLSNDGSVGKWIQQLSSTFGENELSIQQRMNVVDGIKGSWTVKLDSNGFVTGFGSYIDENGVSRFDINANRFNVYDNDTLVIGTKDGEAYIKGAYIDEIKALQIDTRGLDIKNDAGQVVFSSGSGLETHYLKSGIGGNLLSNTDFKLGISTWFDTHSTTATDVQFGRNLAAPAWKPAGANTIAVRRWGTPTGFSIVGCTEDVPVEPGKRYEASGRVATARCEAELILIFFDSAGDELTRFVSSRTTAGGGINLSNYNNSVVFGVAPTNATTCRYWLRAWYNGSSSNTYAWLTQPYLGRAGVMQDAPSVWSASNFIEKVNASNVSTYIDDLAIQEAQIANLSVTNAKIGKAIWSDDFNGVINPVTGVITNNGTQGWAQGKGGKAVYNDVVVRGHVEAESGHFKGTLEAGIVKTASIESDGVSVTFSAFVNANMELSNSFNAPYEAVASLYIEPGYGGYSCIVTVNCRADKSTNVSDPAVFSFKTEASWTTNVVLEGDSYCPNDGFKTSFSQSRSITLPPEGGTITVYSKVTLPTNRTGSYAVGNRLITATVFKR